MSSEQSLDPQIIEETKQRIRSLVGEIAQFSKSEVQPGEFYAEMLPRIVQALAAIGGVVWTLEDQGRIALQYQVDLQKTGLPEKDKDDLVRHGRLLQKVIRTGEGLLVQPNSGSGEEDGGGNPTDWLLVLGPLKTELEVVGVVEIFQRPDAAPTTQKGYLRFLLQMCELAADYLRSRQLRTFSDRQVLWTQLEEFARLVHASLDPRDTAYTIANEGRRLIECDRVSVAIRRGERCYVEAVSGQDQFDKRSNTIRLLNHLTTVVVASGEPMWYTGDTSNLAPQVEDALQEYVDESHSKMVAVIPLARPEREETDKERPDEPKEAPEPVGALVVELIEDNRIPEKMRHRVDVVCQHSSVALANALEHENLFLMPVWRALGKMRWLLRARYLPRVIGVVVLIVALVLALIFVPYEFAPKSDGTLEPKEKCSVYARVDGTVEEVRVNHGDTVTKGQELVILRNWELQQRHLKTVGDLAQAKEDLLATESRIASRSNLTPEERSKLTADMAIAREKISNLTAEEKILEQQVNDLRVCSPIDGKVTTWDLKNVLRDRPVHQGQLLVEVVAPDAPWQLELHVPEENMGFVTRAQNALYARIRDRLREVVRQQLRDDIAPEHLEAEVERQVAAVPDQELRATLRLNTKAGDDPKEQGEDMDDQLNVTYTLATASSEWHYGKATEIHYYADVRGEEGNTVLVRVTIDKDELRPEYIRQGAGVTAKIECGKRAIGYVFLHKVFAWVSKIRFRWF